MAVMFSTPLFMTRALLFPLLAAALHAERISLAKNGRALVPIAPLTKPSVPPPNSPPC